MSALSAVGQNPSFHGLGNTVDTPDPKNKSLDGIMQRVLQQKEKNVQKALDKKWDRYSPTLIGGDFFSMGYLAFEGVQALLPATQSIAAVVIATCVCGIIAGAINIGVAYLSYKESKQAFHNGDTVTGFRLAADCFFLFWIGVVMILVSLSAQISLLGGVGAFFATNPWVLPVLFFVITIPLLGEIFVFRILPIWRNKDLASTLKLDEMKQLLQKDIVNWNEISNLFTHESPFNLKELQKMMGDGAEESMIIETLSGKMEELQADMGVTAGVEAFKLLLNVLRKEKSAALDQIASCEGKIKQWNRRQHVRLLQQILFIVSFIISMIALGPNANANTLNAGQNFAMSAANAIPLHMDLFWPFERNTTLIVPKVEVEDLRAPIIQAKENPGDSFFLCKKLKPPQFLYGFSNPLGK